MEYTHLAVKGNVSQDFLAHYFIYPVWVSGKQVEFRKDVRLRIEHFDEIKTK